MKVSELTPTERPAYRFTHKGREALTNAELVTLACGLASIGQAETLLVLGGGTLRGLGSAAKNVVRDALGGRLKHKAVQIEAIFELGRRYAEEGRADGVVVRSPRDVVGYMSIRLEDLVQEEFHVLALDAQHRLIRDITISKGILNTTLVAPREIFRAAIEVGGCAAIILCHNHPSGDPSPSADDRNVTDQMVTAGRLLDMPVHDHIIIGRGRYTSFAEAGLL